MKIMTLDPKATHANNPDCPSRLAPMPGGGWMCVDCGFQLIQRLIDTDHEDATAPVTRAIERLKELGAKEKACHGRPPILGSGVHES